MAKTLLCYMFLKENINFWQDLLPSAKSVESLPSLTNFTSTIDIEDIALSSESEDAAKIIVGYEAKQIFKKSARLNCNLRISDLNVSAPYFEHFSKGGLTVPSEPLAAFVYKGFALLDYFDKRFNELPSCVQAAAIYFLNDHFSD